MAKLIPSAFSKWQLTPDEYLQYSVIPDTYKIILQNHIAEAAEKRLALTFDPTNPLEFAQAEAEIKGQIGILQFLLAESSSSETQLRNP